MRLATSTFADLPGERTIYVDGAASLLEETHGLTLGTLQTLLQMMEEKQRLVRLLNEVHRRPGPDRRSSAPNIWIRISGRSA